MGVFKEIEIVVQDMQESGLNPRDLRAFRAFVADDPHLAGWASNLTQDEWDRHCTDSGVECDSEAVALLKLASRRIQDVADGLTEDRLVFIRANGALIDAVDHLIHCLKNDSRLLARLAFIQAEAEPHLDVEPKQRRSQ